MDPQVQASFIPKKSFDTGTARGEGAFGSLFLLIAIFLLLASVAAAGGVYAYQRYLANSIVQQSDSLQKAEAAFDPGAIQDLSRMDSRINNALTLLQGHVAPSALFTFLSTQTLQSVQFTSFSYELQTNGSAKISLNGLADSFSAVALQSDQLNANKLLKGVVFSNIRVDTNGKIAFSVEMSLGSASLNYANNIGSATGAVSKTGTTQTPASTTQQEQPMAGSSVPASSAPASTTAPSPLTH